MHVCVCVRALSFCLLVSACGPQNVPFMIKQGNNYTGFAYDLLVALATKLNFRFELFDITDRDTGGDGTYGALVRELTAGVSTSVVMLILQTFKQKQAGYRIFPPSTSHSHHFFITNSVSVFIIFFKPSFSVLTFITFFFSEGFTS